MASPVACHCGVGGATFGMALCASPFLRSALTALEGSGNHGPMVHPLRSAGQVYFSGDVRLCRVQEWHAQLVGVLALLDRGDVRPFRQARQTTETSGEVHTVALNCSSSWRARLREPPER